MGLLDKIGKKISRTVVPPTSQGVKGEPTTVEDGYSFFSRVAGVSHPNDDGSSRQSYLKKCKVGDALKLQHLPIPQDENAVAICRKDGKQLGWMTAQVAEQVGPLLDIGTRVDATISDLTGGTKDKPTLGCNIEVTIYEPGEG